MGVGRQRGQVSLADFFTALRHLQPMNHDAVQALLQLLNLEIPLPAPAPKLSGVYDQKVSPEWLRKLRPSPAPVTRRPDNTPSPTVVTPAGQALAPKIEVLRDKRAAGEKPSWVSLVPAMARPTEYRLPSQPIEPLFHPGQVRGILIASLAARSFDGPIDALRVIAQAARLEPIDSIPRLPGPTLRRGAQVLVDQSTAMDPFLDDKGQILTAISQVVGVPRLRVFHFIGCPTRGVFSARQDEASLWSPPPHGTPVVLISDLGIGGSLLDRDHSTRGEWLGMAQRCRAKSCPVLAFVPFAPDRWDRELARRITMIHWDRRTTAGTVRRAVGPGHAVI